jgi:hypothetical protein
MNDETKAYSRGYRAGRSRLKREMFRMIVFKNQERLSEIELF